MLFEETPRSESDYEDGLWRRTLTVGARCMSSWSATDKSKWETNFQVKTERAAEGILGFAALRPWGLLELPETVQWTRDTAITDCLTLATATDPYSQEHRSGYLLEAADGTVLMASGRSLLHKGGSVETAPRIPLQIELKWVEAGCGSFCDGTWRDPWDEYWHSVAVQVGVSGKNELKTTLPGERAQLEIDGVPYIFALEFAHIAKPPSESPVPAGQELCGRALWMLYREGVWQELNENGTGAKSSPPVDDSASLCEGSSPL
jgi:hypothetical protein